MAQPGCVPHDVRANASIHARAVRDARARVVVFPELSLTGYELDATPVDPEAAALDPIVRACGEAGSVALVGAPVAGPRDQVFIAMLAVSPTGVSVLYRKRWLGEEECIRLRRFRAGPRGGGYTQTAGSSAIWSSTGAALARAGTLAGGLAKATLVAP